MKIQKISILPCLPGHEVGGRKSKTQNLLRVVMGNNINYKPFCCSYALLKSILQVKNNYYIRFCDIWSN